MAHLTAAKIEAGLVDVWESPDDDGQIELIVRRPVPGEREVVDEGTLDVTVGLVGDGWSVIPCRKTPDQSPHPEMQLTLINARFARLIAVEEGRQVLAGDQLHVDLDLSVANLPPGTRLELGSAVIEITEEPHNGCAKFVTRFGRDAQRLVSSPGGQERRLRGANARVVVAGTIRQGDGVRKVTPA